MRSGADHRRRSPCVRTTLAPAPTTQSVSVHVRPDLGAVVDRVAPVQLDARAQRHVAAELTSTSTQVVAGSTTVTPARIQSSSDAPVELGAEPRRAARGR